MTLTDDELRKFGNTVQLVGGAWAGDGKLYLCLFPEESGTVFPGLGADGEMEVFMRMGAGHPLDVEVLNMDSEEWTRFLRQTDVMETEILAKSRDGSLTKAIVRKSSRQVEQTVSWRVFKRDGYACRYCGRDDVPLTVDHLVCWEVGGPSTEANLVSACRKCNRVRGNIPYQDWLSHEYYVQVSFGLSPSARLVNEEVAPTLDSMPRKIHVHTR